MRDISNLKGKIFRHFKGDLYLVEDFVKHSETQETMVLYRALYGDCGLFVRPYDMFVEEVPEGKTNPTGQKYRFQEFEVKTGKGAKAWKVTLFHQLFNASFPPKIIKF